LSSWSKSRWSNLVVTRKGIENNIDEDLTCLLSFKYQWDCSDSWSVSIHELLVCNGAIANTRFIVLVLDVNRQLLVSSLNETEFISPLGILSTTVANSRCEFVVSTTHQVVGTLRRRKGNEIRTSFELIFIIFVLPFIRTIEYLLSFMLK